mgnify:CR=1 FL=1
MGYDKGLKERKVEFERDFLGFQGFDFEVGVEMNQLIGILKSN